MKQKIYSTQLSFKLSPEEKLKLKQNAKKCGLGISKYIRKCSIENNPRFLSDEDRLELSELKAHALEIKRALNLHHEKRKETSPFLKRLRSFIINAKD
jgi:hypothetical protein